MTRAAEWSHSYVIFVSSNVISSHFRHTDYSYAIGIVQSLEYRKISGQKHFRRFFMFSWLCFVFDDYLSDIKLKNKYHRHEYSLKYRALKNPWPPIEIRDYACKRDADLMELPRGAFFDEKCKPLITSKTDRGVSSFLCWFWIFSQFYWNCDSFERNNLKTIEKMHKIVHNRDIVQTVLKDPCLQSPWFVRLYSICQALSDGIWAAIANCLGSLNFCSIQLYVVGLLVLWCRLTMDHVHAKAAFHYTWFSIKLFFRLCDIILDAKG